MATVYLGRKRGTGGLERLVAIKCCHPHLRRDPAFVTMFLDEARLASRIHHPNVVATLDVGDGDALYFVMQYVEGMSLSEWLTQLLAQNQRIAEDLLLRVMIDSLAGLHAAHELRDHDGNSFRLVHRDVSPQNLLIGLDGVTRIADFGIAKAETRATRTRTGQVKGKTGYMPPEQILGEPLDRRADLYAAGVVFWEALVGRRLFEGESDAATINQVLNAEIPAPSTVTNASPAFDALVQRALQFQADDRYATAVEFSRALENTGLAVASHRAVGDAVSEMCREQVLRSRSEALRQSSAQLAPLSGQLGKQEQFALRTNWLKRIKVVSLVAGMVGIALLISSIWVLRIRRPAIITPSPIGGMPSAVVASLAPVVSWAPPPLAAAPIAESTEVPVRKPARTPRQKPATLVVVHPNVEFAAHASTEVVAPNPPPVASTSPARPRAKPSEFRPPDL
jgi:serine/threonine-protein kinase